MINEAAFYQKLQTLNKLLESEGEEFVAGVVEVEAVGGVFLRDLGVVGVEAELVVEVENGNVELLGGLFYHLNVSDESLCVGALDGAGRGLEIIDVAVTAARGSHENDGLARIIFAQEVHKEVNAAAEGRGGLVADLSEGSVAVDVVVYAAVNNDHIGGLVHIVNSAAEAEVVAGLFARVLLMSQTGAADALVIDLRKLAHLLEALIVSAVGSVNDANALGDAVAKEIYFEAFNIHKKDPPFCDVIIIPQNRGIVKYKSIKASLS